MSDDRAMALGMLHDLADVLWSEADEAECRSLIRSLEAGEDKVKEALAFIDRIPPDARL